MKKLFLFLFVTVAFVAQIFAQTPEWIWFNKTGAAEVRYFRKAIEVPAGVTKAELVATADDGLILFINGEQVMEHDDWNTPVKVDVTAKLKPGANVLAIRAHNGDNSPAGAIAQLTLTTSAGRVVVSTDATWKGAEKADKDWDKSGFDDSKWSAVKSLGKLGVAPWNALVFNGAGAVKAGKRVVSNKREATPVEALHTLPGFNVELLASAEAEEGSWVNMCRDDKGRLIISPQYPRANPDAGLLRITLGADGKIAKREFIAKPLYDAQGLLFAKGALWVVVNKYSASFDSGLYRVTDDGSDTWTKIELIKKIPGGGEHGPHAVELGPDGNIYVMAGNHTKLVEGIDPTSPHRNFQEDHVLPRQWDGNGHAAGLLAPGGQIYRVSPDGKKWELFCAGFRNEFDMAFNVDGELFTYDSDMEWDWGMPWYRPTRVNHAVSGGEFGWRSGTGKWPDYSPDSIGSCPDIGVGCPTGVRTGLGAKFPAKYQRALYILDWTYGRLIAVHLQPNGASYTGTWENFLCPAGLADPSKEKRSLNLTDLVIGNDGAMYFVIGGRGTASGLYRVTYNGKESTATANQPNKEGAEARALRHKLEAFHGKVDAQAVDFLWPHLNSEDRALRYAARIALEWQPVAQWQARALSEKSAHGGLTALLALARVGGKEVQDDCLKALAKWPLATLPEAQQLDKIRILQVSLARHGRPSEAVASMASEKLSASYPNTSSRVNRELSQVLITLGAPDVVGKTLTLMAAARTQEDMIHYLFHLRTAKHWTLDERREYFSYYTKDRSGYAHQGDTVKWFDEAGRPYADGSSYGNFMKNFVKEAVANLSESEKTELAPVLASIASGVTGGKKGGSDFPAAKTRAFVKEWKTAELEPHLSSVTKGRNFEKGRQAFVDAQCLACHRFGNEGGGVGPDLTAVVTRFGHRDILESILEPSKVVSEQFQNTTVLLKNGDDVTGRLVEESGDKLVLVPNQLEPNKRIEVKKSDVKSRSFSKISPMPEGLVNTLSQDDILDLIAFLESAGRKGGTAFAK